MGGLVGGLGVSVDDTGCVTRASAATQAGKGPKGSKVRNPQLEAVVMGAAIGIGLAGEVGQSVLWRRIQSLLDLSGWFIGDRSRARDTARRERNGGPAGQAWGTSVAAHSARQGLRCCGSVKLRP